MTEERSPEPVKLIVAALCSSPGALERGIEGLQARRGDIDHQGPPRPFDLSAYYEEEMGTGLQRSSSPLIGWPRPASWSTSSMSVSSWSAPWPGHPGEEPTSTPATSITASWCSLR